MRRVTPRGLCRAQYACVINPEGYWHEYTEKRNGAMEYAVQAVASLAICPETLVRHRASDATDLNRRLC